MLHNSGFPGEDHETGESAKSRIAWSDSVSQHEFLQQPLRYIAASLETSRRGENAAVAVLPARADQPPAQFKGPTFADRMFQFGASGRIGSSGQGEIVAPALRALGVVGVLFAVGWGAHTAGLFKFGGEPLAARGQVQIAAAEASLVASNPLPVSKADIVALPEEIKASISAERVLPSVESAQPKAVDGESSSPIPAETNLALAPVSAEPVAEKAVAARAPAVAEAPAELAKAAESVDTPVAEAAPATPDPLHSADPRWGDAAAGSQGPSLAGVVQPQGSSDQALALVKPDADEDSQAAVAALNALAVPTPEASPDKPAKKKSAAKASAEQTGKGGGRIRTAVKLRSGPDNGNRVIGVVPANASVRVLQCKIWCKIAWNGKQGYVFKKFVVR